MADTVSISQPVRNRGNRIFFCAISAVITLAVIIVRIIGFPTTKR